MAVRLDAPSFDFKKMVDLRKKFNPPSCILGRSVAFESAIKRPKEVVDHAHVKVSDRRHAGGVSMGARPRVPASSREDRKSCSAAVEVFRE